MNSLFSQAASSSKVQLVATALVSGAVAASVLLGYQRLQREERISRLKSSIPSPSDEGEDLQQVRQFLSCSLSPSLSPSPLSLPLFPYTS